MLRKKFFSGRELKMKLIFLLGEKITFPAGDKIKDDIFLWGGGRELRISK